MDIGPGQPRPQQHPKPVRPSSSSSGSGSRDRVLLRELCYAFQGIEGSVLKRAGGGVDGGRYTITEAQRRTLPPSVMQLTLRLAELGWLYSQVKVRNKDRGS